MNASEPAFKVGTRNSRLALIQAAEAVTALQPLLPSIRFNVVPFSSPGDRDKATDLRCCDPDFFTRDLHDALRDRVIDCAIHSAKDLEDPVPPGLDWAWLPHPANPQDVIVLRRGETLESLRPDAVWGISSQRREAYVRRFFSAGRIVSIRGTIDERLAQLDNGPYEALILAAAALQRLGWESRITQGISREDLPPPRGQGHLALTFRDGDPVWLRIRSLLVKAAIFAGAGCGSAETCTLGARDALARCDICFYDSLLDASLLDQLPPQAERVDVGKRCGDHTVPQSEINRLLSDAARRGQRVVRLKGGDPGIFGRLAEEIETLDTLHLPYRVIPGVSSLNAATTGTGLLLTRRGVSRGFTVMTPRQQNGGGGSVRADARAELPLAFFMGVGVLDEIGAQLAAEGLPETTPVAVVFDAGSVDETIIRGTLDDIAKKLAAHLPPPTNQHLSPDSRPGIILVGSVATGGYHPEWSALQGRRVLLPGSDALQKTSVDAVRDFGGIPLPLPLIRLVPDPTCLPLLKTIRTFDGLVVTSPSSVRMLMQLLPETGLDVRALPKILVAGPGTAEAFKAQGVTPDAIPDRNFGAEGVLELAQQAFPAGASLLRLRSHRAGPGLADALGQRGFRVTDGVSYFTEPIRPDRIPAFDAVFFASASAVEAYLAVQPPNALAEKTVMAMGQPTWAALKKHGVQVERVAVEASVESAIQTLAAVMVEKEIGAFGESALPQGEGRAVSPRRPLGKNGESARPVRRTLPHDIPTWVEPGAVFFITICVESRGLAPLGQTGIPERLWDSIRHRADLQQWWPHLVLVMPDHLHALVSFARDPGMRRVVQDWKRFTARTLGIVWQDDFFDHRLRKDESFVEKAHYIRMNPVRAGLVTAPEDWPHVWTMESGGFGPSAPLRAGETTLPQAEGRAASPALSDVDGPRRPVSVKNEDLYENISRCPVAAVAVDGGTPPLIRRAPAGPGKIHLAGLCKIGPEREGTHHNPARSISI
jgi:uroporphyrinogen III methyltransferase/synthase